MIILEGAIPLHAKTVLEGQLPHLPAPLFIFHCSLIGSYICT